MASVKLPRKPLPLPLPLPEAVAVVVAVAVAATTMVRLLSKANQIKIN